MRLLLSFFGATLIALALFALMLVLIMPPRDDREPPEELTRVNFVRSVSDTDSESRLARACLWHSPATAG